MSNFIVDNYTEASPPVNLSAHTPDTGGAWHNDAANILGEVFINPSGDLVYRTDVGNWNGDYNGATPPSTDYTAQTTLHYLSQVGSAGIRVRTNSGDFYGLHYDASVPQLVLEKRVSTTFTTLATYALDMSTAGDTIITLSAIGTSTATRLYVSIAGVLQTAVDPGSTYLNTAGFAGVYMHSSGNSINTTGVHGRNFLAFGGLPVFGALIDQHMQAGMRPLIGNMT